MTASSASGSVMMGKRIGTFIWMDGGWRMILLQEARVKSARPARCRCVNINGNAGVAQQVVLSLGGKYLDLARPGTGQVQALPTHGGRDSGRLSSSVRTCLAEAATAADFKGGSGGAKPPPGKSWNFFLTV